MLNMNAQIIHIHSSITWVKCKGSKQLHRYNWVICVTLMEKAGFMLGEIRYIRVKVRVTTLRQGKG